jgi:hypothetical protein
MKIGDLVEIQADNCGGGLGLIVEIETDETMSGTRWESYRVLQRDGRLFYYFKDEIHLVK